MFKQKLISAAMAIGLGFAGAATAQDAEQNFQQVFGDNAAATEFSWLDAATWVAPLKGIPGAVPESTPYALDPWKPGTWTIDSFLKPAPIPRFDLSRPSGWAVFLKPETYAGAMNPATYSQFLLPEYWAQFINPVTYFSWLNPYEYTGFFNPLAYLQWMNPAAYAAYMNPINYLEPANPVNYLAYVNPKTYLEWFNGKAYTLKPMMTGETNAVDLLDPSTWTQSVATTYDPFDPISFLKN